MKTIRNWMMVAALVIPAFIASPASAQEATPGSMWWAEAYCTTEDAVRLLSRRVAEAGREGYIEVMTTNGVSCWDTNLLNNIPVPRVMILEKIWQVVTPSGQKLNFWTARDKYGNIGWTWFIVGTPSTPA